MSYFITNDCGKNQYEKVGEIRTPQYLAPAYIRIGGTSADCLYFNQDIVRVFLWVQK